MKRLAGLSIVAVLAILMLSGSPAAASVRMNVNVLWDPNPADGSQVFLHVSNEAFPVPRERASAVFYDIPDPYNDYPVLAFIACNAHVDIGTVWAYKKKGHHWVNVMFHFGVPPSALFVDLPRPPGPPYGNAYGHWKRNGDRMGRDILTNEDIHYWVRMRAVAGYAGVPPRQVYQWRESGQQFDTIAVRQYNVKHGKGPKHDEEGGRGRGRGKDKSHDKD